MTVQHVKTTRLEMAYECAGPEGGPPLVLLHGWPDDVRTWDRVAPVLHAAGYRTYAPYLRGFGPTRFLDTTTTHTGPLPEHILDVLAFADALGVARLTVIGHDWGAWVAYMLAAAHRERIQRIVAISVGYQPGDQPTPPNQQAQAYWYQWLLGTGRGEERVRSEADEFTLHLWKTWSPPGWFTEAEFQETAESFKNPDWADVTLDLYRERWERKGRPQLKIEVPTCVIHGAEDGASLVSSSEGKEEWFSSRYERHVLPGIGHFSPRESPAEVARLVLAFLDKTR